MHYGEIFEKISEGTYMLCMHCERAYKYGNFRHSMDPVSMDMILQVCPYEGCDGDAVIDAEEWGSIRDHHPDYPEIPELDKVYPLN